MADCYYHGQSAPGPCPDCARESRENLEQGSTPTDNPDIRPGDYDDMSEKKAQKPGTVRKKKN